MSHTNVAPLRPLDFVGHRPGTPLAGEWTEEMAAALLVELMHQVGMRDGCILADQAAFDSEHREAWLSLQVQTLLDQNDLSRVQVAACEDAYEHTLGGVGSIDDAGRSVSRADELLEKGVKHGAKQLEEQTEDPAALVEALVQYMRDAQGCLDMAETEIEDADKALKVAVENLKR